MMKTIVSNVPLHVLTILALGVSVAAAQIVPTADQMDAGPLETVERLDLAPVDLAAAAVEDAAREEEGLPPRFAEPVDVSLSPEEIGTWETLPGGHLLLWRLRIIVPGALSLNVGFGRYHLPAGGRLVLYPAEGRQTTWEFTERDNREHGELWTPVVLTDDLVVELTLPVVARSDYELRLDRIGKGYRFFGEPSRDEPLWCMNDVICPEGDPWRVEINSVAVYHYVGYWTCSGVMVNNTAEDGTPYFLTARHCGVGSTYDHTMVVYWNFQSPTCGQRGGGSLADHQVGAIWRARYEPSDVCLVELEEMPDPSWNVTYSGWDRSDSDALWAVGIHHPWSQEKAISFEDDPTTTTSNMGYDVPGDGTHIRVEDWDDGTTWYGSSGSPLYNQNHHVVGQLHSGFSECGLDSCDWYGRFSVSWYGGGSNISSLHHWLDPLELDPTTLDYFAPFATVLTVTPDFGLASQGNQGGPFAPASLVYTLWNHGNSTIDYQVATDMPWLSLTGGTNGSLSPGANTEVTVSIGAGADELPIGDFDGTVSFLNMTDGDGNTNRPVRLLVGERHVAYEWNLDIDPDWIGEDQWAWGEPLGQGGDNAPYGFQDPSSGYTGPNVLGYNLAGDYTDGMPEYHLTTGAIDCSALQAVSVRFQRWLNVELFPYDRAFVCVSRDSVSWTTVWENNAAVTDSSWQLVEYDLSEIADGQPTVYLRWTMGPTNVEGWTFSGWNIDDIEILGLPVTAVGDHVPVHTLLGRATPNPFNPQTILVFEIYREQDLVVAVYDLLGQRVRILAEGRWTAGSHEVSWSGRDSHGRAMPSGTYIVRLETDSGVEARKVMLVR